MKVMQEVSWKIAARRGYKKKMKKANTPIPKPSINRYDSPKAGCTL